MLSRRRFVVWLSSAVPLALVARRADALGAAWIADDASVLRAMAEAILPSELGPRGAAAVARDFQRWVDEYRAYAELVHGYGTSALRFAPVSPRAKWAAQLAELKALPTVTVEARRARIRSILEREDTDRLPEVGAAAHVAAALLAFFYQSARANDLCYRAQVGKETCRPLAAAARQPLPLVARGV